MDHILKQCSERKFYVMWIQFGIYRLSMTGQMFSMREFPKDTQSGNFTVPASLVMRAIFLKYYYEYTLDPTDNEFQFEKKYLTIDSPEILEKISVQSKDFLEFDISPNISKEYDALRKEHGAKKKFSASSAKVSFIQKSTNWNIDNIKDEKTLDEAIEVLHESTKENIDDYYIKEVHAYAMILGKNTGVREATIIGSV